MEENRGFDKMDNFFEFEQLAENNLNNKCYVVGIFQ